nr:family 20 glycosylhydrolase [Chitinophagaceae bacterium]
GSHSYFDHYQGNKKTEPLAIGGYTTVKKVYSYQPIPEKLNGEKRKYILGAQGNVWTEYIPTPEHAMYMALPRLCALSEVLWSKEENKNYEEFTERLISHFNLLDTLKMNYAKSIFDVNVSTSSIDNKNLFINLSSDLIKFDIRFTLDGSEPNLNSPKYTNPILISKSTILKAALFDVKNRKGNVFSQRYNLNLATGKKIELTNPPNKSYNTGGEKTLVDGVVGDLPWSGNQWLGWRGEDMELNLDLGSTTSFSKIKMSFLKAPESWIHLPSQLYIKISNDGIRYETLKTLNEFDVEKIALEDQLFYEGKITARFIKIVAPSRHIIPSGFAGEGEPAWMFCSEIIVE